MTKLSLTISITIALAGLSLAHGADSNAPAARNAEATRQPSGQSNADLAVLQTRIKNRYEEVEKLLFKLMELEAESNPRRADLLRRAYDQSRTRLTAVEMQKVIERLARKDYDRALEGQQAALKDISDLLELLKLEDPAERIKSEKERVKEYIQEVERLIRLEKHLRSQNEGGLDADRLAKTQGQVADRAKALDDRIRKDNAPAGSADAQPQSDSEGQDRPSGDGKSSESGDGKQGEEPGTPQEGDEGSDSKPADGEGEGEGSDGKGTDEPTEGEGGSSQSGEKPSEGGNGQSGNGSQGEGSGGGGQSQQQEQENPVRKRIQAAEEKMRQAQQKLEEAKRKESIDDQLAAQDELEQAKKELEEILRQLREKEVERMLAMLETRFRQMREREQAVYEATLLLDKQPAERRDNEFNIEAGRQSFEQRSIAEYADRTFNMLVEEGSSIAFPETVKQMAADMRQVSERLARVNVGPLTQEIEEDIIDTLDYLIAALERAQQMNEENADAPPGQPGPIGEPPLVDQIAELKMIRGLQERVYKRHVRYSRLLDDPDDPVGQVESPELEEALDRLAERQKKIHQITQDIVLGKNQ